MIPGIWYIVGIYTTFEVVYSEVGGKFGYIKYPIFGYKWVKIPTYSQISASRRNKSVPNLPPTFEYTTSKVV